MPVFPKIRCDPQNGIFIAESPKVIERALDAGCIPISFLTEDRHLENQALPFLERCPDIPFFSAPFEVLTQLTGFALTRGMLCAMKRPKLPSVEELCQASSRLVILENIMNPTNIGAIFRSAAALGMDGVLLTSDCSNPLYRRDPCQHGNRFPDSVDLPGQQLAASGDFRIKKSRLPHRFNGASL